MFTEEEAKKRICPFWAVSSDWSIRCEGANCMMWRWADWPGKTEKPRGYCGLAGRPQYYEQLMEKGDANEHDRAVSVRTQNG